MSFKDRHPVHYERLRRVEKEMGLHWITTKIDLNGLLLVGQPPLTAEQHHLKEYVAEREAEQSSRRRIIELATIAAITWSGAVLGSFLSANMARSASPSPAFSAPQTHSTEEQRPLEGADARGLHSLEEGPVGQEPAVDPVDVEPVVDDSGSGVEATGGSEPPESAGDAGKVRLKTPGSRPLVDDPIDLAAKRQRLQQ